MPYLDLDLTETSGLSPLAVARRYMLALLLAAVLASVEVDRAPVFRQPEPIVMVLPPPPRPRVPRARPYRAHYRRSAR